MDPLRKYCLVKDSFTNIDKTKETPLSYNDKNFSIVSPATRRKNVYSGENSQELEEVVKSYLSLKIKNVDPFYEIEKYSEYFKRRGSYILADLDFIFNYTGQEDGYLRPQIINEDYSYVVIDGDLGSLEYLQYRLPASVSISKCGVDSIRDSKLDKRYINLNCDDNMVDYTLSIRPLGVDLFANVYFEGYYKYLQNIKDMLLVTKIGGTYVGKISLDLRNEELKNLLKVFYILSLAFEKLTILSAFLDSDYSLHIVGEGYKGKNSDILQFLKDLDKVNISQSFIEYLQRVAKDIKLERESYEGKEYNLYKCVALLNLF